MKPQQLYIYSGEKARALCIVNIDNVKFAISDSALQDKWTLYFSGADCLDIWATAPQLKSYLRSTWLSARYAEDSRTVFLNSRLITCAGHASDLIPGYDSGESEKHNSIAVYFADGAFILVGIQYAEIFKALKNLERGGAVYEQKRKAAKVKPDTFDENNRIGT
jgi:hypothetical protein